MIVRDDITAETYCPIPSSTADYRRLKKDFRLRTSDVELDLSHTDDGMPFDSVTVLGDADADLRPCIIIRSEHGWQMHRGGDGPLFELASTQEVAEFLVSGVRSKA